MARTVRNAKIDTRSARSRLPANKSIYWTSIAPGCSLGYRKGAKGGVWVAKYVGNGLRREKRIGPTDDVMDADGVVAVSFAQAQAEARDWFTRTARSAAGKDDETGPYTVGDAMSAYLAEFGESRSHYATAKGHIETFILPRVGGIEADSITAAQIRSFHGKIADTPARIRTRRGEPQKFKAAPETPDELRKRRATANKILTTLKAGLNRAYGDGKIPSDAAWRKVKPFKGVDAARIRYLEDNEVTRLANACEPDFRLLVLAGVLTGARYGELGRLTAADFDAGAGTLFIAASKSDKSRHVVLNEEGQRLFSRACLDHARDELLFVKADGEPWGVSHQRRRMFEACKAARITPAISFHILRHTHASQLAMRGVQMGVIAHQLGHADERMASKHYAHLSPSYIADTIRQNFPSLGIVEDENVELIRHR